RPRRQVPRDQKRDAGEVDVSNVALVDGDHAVALTRVVAWPAAEVARARDRAAARLEDSCRDVPVRRSSGLSLRSHSDANAAQDDRSQYRRNDSKQTHVVSFRVSK